MLKSEYDAAIAAVQSMLLEVSGNPKAGNVDREHNFEDLKYEHFIASSVASFPTFLDAAFKKSSMGKLVFNAIKETSKWHTASNVHFGAFLLLIPLVMSWNSDNILKLTENAVENVKNTNFRDSIAILKAFKLSSARVLKVRELSLNSDETESFLSQNKVNVYSWMKMAPEENIIAKELTNGFKISVKGSKMLLKFFEDFNDVNLAIVLCYHNLLSKYLDPLVISKYGVEVAYDVQSKAKTCLEEFEMKQNIDVFKKLDYELIVKKINPGTIADLTISSIFLALAGGWRF